VFTVVYDACVLYPAPLRDLLVRIAARGLVRARGGGADEAGLRRRAGRGQ
jgi:hypothetical protein